jgi:hypothetical protein
VDEDEELIVERIEAFGITFSRPEFWSFRREHDETYLYWDEDAGSMRVTPFRATVDIERYLTDLFEKERDHDPAWRSVDGRKAVAWISDGESRSHFCVTGRDDLVIVCSYAYDPSIYAEDDEFYAPAVDAGLEQFDAVLASMRF